MKPINYHKKAAKSAARVKMLIKSRLSWLSGYPHFEKDQLFWMVSDAGFYFDKTIHIDSRTISSTQRTINTLYRDYPVALPDVVGDADVWHERCCTYLDHAKQLLLAQSDEIFSLFDQENSYRHGLDINSYLNNDRKDVLAKLSWKNFIDRSDLNKSLSFFHSHHDIDHTISDKDLINLIGLHCIDPKKSHQLIDFILTAGMSASAINTNTICHTKFSWFSPYLKKITPKNIKKHKNTFDPVDFPTADNHTIILNFIHCLSSFNKARVVRALSIFGRLSLKEPFNQWHHWWVQVRSTCQKIKNHITFSDSGGSQLKKIHELQTHLKKLHDNKPQETFVVDVFTAITYFSQYKNVSSALTILLGTITHKKTLFPASQLWLVYFHGLLKWENHKHSKISHYLQALNNFIRQIEHTDEGFPWSTIPQYHWNSIDCILLEITDTQQITSFFAALTSLYAQGDIQLKAAELKSIQHLHQANYDPIEITKILKTLRTKKVDEPLPKQVCHIAKGLHLENTEIIALYQLHEKLYNTDFFDECLIELFDLFRDMDALEHFKSLLFEMPIAQIFNIYSLVQVVTKKSGADCIPAPLKIGEHFEDWITQYPSPLRKHIAQLNSLNSDAKKWLDHILKNIWWTKEMIASEIASLKSVIDRSKTPKSDITKRIVKFKKQLNNPQTITAKQLTKITNKIETKIKHWHFSQWQSQLEKQFIKDWSSIFDMKPAELPDWLMDTQMVIKLLPILSFASSSKNLAIKVIKERIKQPYCFFENHKKNTAFIEKLRSEGIQWPVKLSDRTYLAKNGQTITIAVEGDPLQVLDMGGHFGTCLSPGHMNYFSVFANIADVNKLVIYARNTQQNVVGRVLLGITDQGGLQIFYRYSHHKDFEFHEHLQLFINDMVRQTGLTITKMGHISPLCGTSWYDDGPENIPHDIECFRPNSTFRQQLSSLSALDFQQKIHQALKPKTMNSMIFSLLLQLPEVKKNHKLFKPLMHMSLTIPHIANHDLIAFYKIANDYNKGAEFYSTHRKQMLNYQLKLVNEYWFDYCYLVVSIAEHHPSDALKIIKANAKINKLDWKKQPIKEAIDATVIALNNLGRHQLAEKIASKKRH